MQSARREEAAGDHSIMPGFNLLDADHDGKISRDDLTTFYSASGLPSRPSKEDIASMISTADINKDGYVQLDKFESILGRDATGGGGVMEEVFRVMDRDGDGKVRFEDLKEYLRLAGMVVGDDDVRAMLKLEGGDEGQGVGFQELVKILTVGSNGVM